MFGKYFIREKITYWFYCLFPLIFTAEIYIYASVTTVTPDIMEMIDILIVQLSFMASGIMLIVQLCSCLIFFIRMCRLTSGQRQGLREAAHNSKKTGNILQSDEVLVYYGMFSKNIILKNQIVSIERYTESNFRHVRGGSISSKMDYIIIKRKSGRDIALMCPMKVLDGYAGELPWTYMIVVVWFGVALAIMALYPVLMKFFYNENDLIEKILFIAGYDWLFWLISVVIIVSLWFLAFYLKKKYIDEESYKGMVMKMTKFWFIACIVMFAGLFFEEKFEQSNLARKDLSLYRKNQYEQIQIHINSVDENSWTECGTRYMYEYMDAEQIDYGVLYGRLDERGLYSEAFLLIGNKDVDLEKICIVHCLENTNIVMDIEVME